MGMMKLAPPSRTAVARACGPPKAWAGDSSRRASMRTKKATDRKYSSAGKRGHHDDVFVGICVKLAITKAPAPMIGGISWPPVDDADSTPAANFGSKPARFINGMVMTPVDAVLAIAEPEMVPVRPEATTATSPGPPTSLPAMARRHVDDEIAGARANQESAENDEQKHIGRRDPGNAAEQRVVAVDRAETTWSPRTARERRTPRRSTTPRQRRSSGRSTMRIGMMTSPPLVGSARWRRGSPPRPRSSPASTGERRARRSHSRRAPEMNRGGGSEQADGEVDPEQPSRESAPTSHASRQWDR